MICKNNVINTEMGDLKIIADDLVKGKIGSADQVSAGIKCLSNDTSFALSIQPNEGQKYAGPMCVHSYDIEVTSGNLTTTSQENIRFSIPVYHTDSYQ